MLILMNQGSDSHVHVYHRECLLPKCRVASAPVEVGDPLLLLFSWQARRFCCSSAAAFCFSSAGRRGDLLEDSRWPGYISRNMVMSLLACPKSDVLTLATLQYLGKNSYGRGHFYQSVTAPLQRDDISDIMSLLTYTRSGSIASPVTEPGHPSNSWLVPPISPISCHERPGNPS